MGGTLTVAQRVVWSHVGYRVPGHLRAVAKLNSGGSAVVAASMSAEFAAWTLWSKFSGLWGVKMGTDAVVFASIFCSVQQPEVFRQMTEPEIGKLV